jgi:hypothetical protein
MITPIDVLDTAVKIGLGAIITGLATYWVAKANRHKTVERERAQRKRDLLEVVAEQTARFDQFALGYWEKVANWLAFTPRTEPMPETLKAELSKLESEISGGYKDLKSAEAKLLLLGEAKCQRLLRDYGEFVTIYRQDVIGARNLEVEDPREYKEQLRQRREKFLNELGHIHTRI